MKHSLLHLWLAALLIAGCGDQADSGDDRGVAPDAEADGDADGSVDDGGSSDGETTGDNDTGGGDFDPDADFVMLAFGDSITAGLNIDQFLGETEEKNWSTGDGVTYSHLSRLQMDLEISSIAVENVAISGATTSSLTDQLGNVETSRADYATVLIGANDVCAWPANYTEALETYKQRVADLVDNLEQSYEGIAVLLVSVPDLNQLYELKKDEASCRQIWAFAGGCNDLLQASATTADRAAFHERWVDMNNALQEVAEARGDNIRYTPDVAETELKVEDVSTLDCFHPSEAGQKRIAEASWLLDLAEYAVEK